jgi:hypothetical protein
LRHVGFGKTAAHAGVKAQSEHVERVCAYARLAQSVPVEIERPGCAIAGGYHFCRAAPISISLRITSRARACTTTPDQNTVVPAVRIGLLSDVHSNLAGLQAVAHELEREGPLDHVVVAGDHLWGGPRPRAVWRLLNERGWTLVLGNADENLADATVDRDFPPGHPYRAAAIRRRRPPLR